MKDDLQELQLTCFRIGDDLFAVDIMRIKEIIRPQKLTNIPKAPPFVEGVINLRGMVIPVIDLRRRFDLPVQGELQMSRLLIVSVARHVIGLVVDEVTEVITVAVGDIKPPPDVMVGVGSKHLIGVCLVKDNLIMLLNLDTIISKAEVAALGTLSN
ncbi:MAG TPA: chemotaxis protein CheW [Geobacterales bacterium]|nr:chemotaxis protein CheW [Geobacterales bacterium]